MSTIASLLQTDGDISRLDREVLLAHTIGQDRSFVLSHPEFQVSSGKVRRYRSFVARRKRHEPVAYILGKKEFYGSSFLVKKRVLIPRPETEHLVESALEILREQLSRRKKIRVAVVDVGTGSGAIIVSLVKEFPSDQRISWFATDLSRSALTIARKNHQMICGGTPVTFVQSDLVSRLLKRLARFDRVIILANLPYLSTTLYRNTSPEVRKYEPQEALLSGSDGLDHYRGLLDQIRWLAKTVSIDFLLEISPEQATLLRQSGFPPLRFLRDLSGRTRVAIGKFE